MRTGWISQKIILKLATKNVLQIFTYVLYIFETTTFILSITMWICRIKFSLTEGYNNINKDMADAQDVSKQSHKSNRGWDAGKIRLYLQGYKEWSRGSEWGWLIVRNYVFVIAVAVGDEPSFQSSFVRWWQWAAQYRCERLSWAWGLSLKSNMEVGICISRALDWQSNGFTVTQRMSLWIRWYSWYHWEFPTVEYCF